MEAEPIFIRQCREPKSDDVRNEWYKARAVEAKAAGCTYCRFSIHPDDINRVMVEGWITRPRRHVAQRWSISARDPAPTVAA